MDQNYHKDELVVESSFDRVQPLLEETFISNKGPLKSANTIEKVIPYIPAILCSGNTDNQ